MMAIRAFSGVRLQYRLHSLFELEEERIIVLRHKQSNPAAPSDAAHTDDLDGRINYPIAIEQHTPVVG